MELVERLDRVVPIVHGGLSGYGRSGTDDLLAHGRMTGGPGIPTPFPLPACQQFVTTAQATGQLSPRATGEQKW